MSGGLDYIPGLIAAFRAGLAGPHIHLGLWTGGAADLAAAQDAMAEAHLDAAGLSDGMTLLDVGCGLGGTVAMAQARVRDARIVSVNIDPRQLAPCREIATRNGNRLEWLEAGAESISMPDGCADVVLSQEAMFHFPSRTAFLAEAARLLRPGGRLVCSDITFPQSAERDRLRTVTEGYAPWPDPDHQPEDLHPPGLEPVAFHDLSDAVQPTWARIVPPGARPAVHPVAAMAALHRAGQLRYTLQVFAKPATPGPDSDLAQPPATA